jgi:hypothetical protein
MRESQPHRRHPYAFLMLPPGIHRRTLMGFAPNGPSETIRSPPMSDVIWLAVLGGLFLATLAYLRLCDEA